MSDILYTVHITMFNLRNSQWHWYYSSHFTNKEPKSYRNYVICPQITLQVVDPRVRPEAFWLQLYNTVTLYKDTQLLQTVCEVKVTQSCPTLCDPMDYTVHGILQARILEWVTFPFSRASSRARDWTKISPIAGGFFTIWATREALQPVWVPLNY